MWGARGCYALRCYIYLYNVIDRDLLVQLFYMTLIFTLYEYALVKIPVVFDPEACHDLVERPIVSFQCRPFVH